MQHSPKLQIEGLFRVSIDQEGADNPALWPMGLNVVERAVFDQVHAAAEQLWKMFLLVIYVGGALLADPYVDADWVVALAAFASIPLILGLWYLADVAARQSARSAVKRYRRDKF